MNTLAAQSSQRHAAPAGSRLDIAQVRQWIKHAAHLLPAQGPITAFVHHNTLHAFEHLPFEQAVWAGAQTFGCHPYMPEADYRRALTEGRILHEDLQSALLEDLGDRADTLLGFLGTRFHLRLAMLAQPLHTGPVAELRWIVAETDALRRFRSEATVETRTRLIRETRHWVMRDLRSGRIASDSSEAFRAAADLALRHFDRQHIEHWDDSTWEAATLHMLWLFSRQGIEYTPPSEDVARHPVRPSEHFHEATGENPDVLVDDLLIRFCAAFLDQGFAHWPLPARDEGFLRSFCRLYGRGFRPVDRWLAGIDKELARVERESVSAETLIVDSLADLGIAEDDAEQFITDSLLALRGFAGMLWQTESRGDRVAQPSPAGTLTEFLAIRLLLDRWALRYMAREHLGYQSPLKDLVSSLPASSDRAARSPERRAFLIFQLAQLLGWAPPTLARLTDREWMMVVRETEQFSSIERRRVYHLAYERRYRLQTLDAVSRHCRRLASEQAPQPPAVAQPAFQVVCCIDDREESFRRHLEEIDPECETFGAPGFFGVAMNYQGAADAHFTPLCPVSIQPKHYVKEQVAYSMEKSERRRRRQRRTIGTVTHRVHIGSRTFAGGWVAAVVGSLATIPLVMRILFPRTTAQLRRFLGGVVRPPEVTQLILERTTQEPGKENGQIGFTVQEMADIVEGLLRGMGLTERFSPIVVMVGHGSSCLNNPHEAAYDCGACGGGRGGPNARAFAQMANDARVRSLLAERGLSIPESTVFVGAYHNTCDDSVTYYDLERLPPSHHESFSRVVESLDAARTWDAHERCRRFESADLDLTPEEALRHVEGRAEDLSQVRPECGHATNALCFIGRRRWSRGLFLDRRCFLQSYDPTRDDSEHSVLAGLLASVIPVCAGINLEYYFSFVDPTGYGCGTKLPHNITSLLGVMNGAASDLRPGLPWQMVEIHEPVRLLCVIESTPEAIESIMAGNPALANLIRGRWVQLAVLDSDTGEIRAYNGNRFELHRVATPELPVVPRSADWYRGWRDHLGYAHVHTPPAPEPRV